MPKKKAVVAFRKNRATGKTYPISKSCGRKTTKIACSKTFKGVAPKQIGWRIEVTSRNKNLLRKELQQNPVVVNSERERRILRKELRASGLKFTETPIAKGYTPASNEEWRVVWFIKNRRRIGPESEELKQFDQVFSTKKKAQTFRNKLLRRRGVYGVAMRAAQYETPIEAQKEIKRGMGRVIREAERASTELGGYQSLTNDIRQLLLEESPKYKREKRVLEVYCKDAKACPSSRLELPYLDAVSTKELKEQLKREQKKVAVSVESKQLLLDQKRLRVAVLKALLEENQNIRGRIHWSGLELGRKPRDFTIKATAMKWRSINPEKRRLKQVTERLQPSRLEDRLAEIQKREFRLLQKHGS